MELLLLLQRRLKAAALLGEHVQHHWLVLLLEELEGLYQQWQIVAIDRAIVVQTKLLEDHASADDSLRCFLGLPGDVARSLAAELLHQPGGAVVQAHVGRIGHDLVEVLRDGADVLVDGPLVVIQDDDHPLGPGHVVQRLIADAVGKRRIAGQRNDVLIAAAHVARDSHSQSGAESGSGVACAKAVMLALSAEHKAVQSTGLTDGVKALLASGEQLVDVTLVADVEDEAVFRGIEDIVHGDGQLDHAQVGADMSAGLGYTEDQPLTNLLGEPLQLDNAEPFYIQRRLDPA